LAAAAPASGFCWDTGFSLMLAAGSYGLYLTQDGNLPAGSNVLTDGFSRSGRADYTAVENLGLAGSGLRFVQVDGTLRTGLWALDYTASAPLDIGQPVPEPSTALSLALGLLLLSAHLARRTPPH
jgi:hypothetical protein